MHQIFPWHTFFLPFPFGAWFCIAKEKENWKKISIFIISVSHWENVHVFAKWIHLGCPKFKSSNLCETRPGRRFNWQPNEQDEAERRIGEQNKVKIYKYYICNKITLNDGNYHSITIESSVQLEIVRFYRGDRTLKSFESRIQCCAYWYWNRSVHDHSQSQYFLLNSTWVNRWLHCAPERQRSNRQPGKRRKLRFFALLVTLLCRTEWKRVRRLANNNDCLHFDCLKTLPCAGTKRTCVCVFFLYDDTVKHVFKGKNGKDTHEMIQQVE